MMNSKSLFHDFLKQISLRDNRDEISSMAYLVFEDLFGLSKTEILAQKSIEVSALQGNHLQQIIKRINAHEPVQYILGEAEFYGRKFKVNSSVLIPRPETEDLIREIKSILKQKTLPFRILDIGTGSGCIPITLALEIPGAEVFATDVSDQALDIAKQNAAAWKAKVLFIHNDILNSEIPFNNLDVIVSNPPYITLSEQTQMRKNVVDYEPHLALFVAEDDPLIFYKEIARKSKSVLNHEGLLLTEINEKFGEEVKNIFESQNFIDVKIINDLSGKNRIVKGHKHH